jgi:hypothetical protein
MPKANMAAGIVIAMIIGGAAGYAGASYQYSAELANYSAQIEKAKSAFERVFPVQPTMLSVGGMIKNISGNTITLQASPSINPFDDLPAVRTVTVTSATKLVKNEQKDPKVLQQEFADFQKAMQRSVPGPGSSVPATLPPTPLKPFNETDIKISDLKTGDNISVEAASDIKTAASFEAVKIVLISTSSVPAGAN